MAEPIVDREALIRMARITASNTCTPRFTPRFTPGEPSFAFSLGRLETFVEALVLAMAQKAGAELAQVMVERDDARAALEQAQRERDEARALLRDASDALTPLANASGPQERECLTDDDAARAMKIVGRIAALLPGAAAQEASHG